MTEFFAQVPGGGGRMAATLGAGLAVTALITSAAWLAGAPESVLGGIAFVGVIGTQVLVMLALRMHKATLRFDGATLRLCVGSSERAISVAAVGLAKLSMPQVGAMGSVMCFSGAGPPITVGAMGRTLAQEVYSLESIAKPDCYVELDVFDRLMTLFAAARQARPASTSPRFEVFANKSSMLNVFKALGFFWLIVMPLTAGAAYLVEQLVPRISAAPPIAAVLVLALAAGLGVRLLLRKRTRSASVERGVFTLTEGGRTLFSVPVNALQIQRIQHDIRARTLRYRLPGLSLRLPDGQTFAVGARHMGGWGAVEAKRSGEPDWLMGPAELPLFAAQLGVRDALTQDW